MDEVDDADLVVERVAALDLGKAGLEACVRVPNPQRPGRRMQELRGYGTSTAQLLAMAGWLRHWQVQRVVMESTSTYWKGVYYLLEAEGFDCWLVNAREVKNVPGRAKTDLLTELSRDLEEGYVRRRVRPVRFAACDRRWGCASGFGRAGGATAGWSRGDGRSVSTVSAC
jgi:transposase